MTAQRFLALPLRAVLFIVCLAFVGSCEPTPDEVPPGRTRDTSETVLPKPTSTFLNPFDRAELAIVGSDGNIYLTDAEGGSITQLTDDARLEPLEGETFKAYSEPTWSPIGDRIAYIQSSGTADGQFEVLILVNKPGQQPVALVSGDDRPFYLYWSPDGESISFLASKPGEALSLWVKNLADEGGRVDGGQPYYWDWAPDGMRMFVHVGGSSRFNPGGAYLGFLSPGNGLEKIELAPVSFQAPAISPDGTRILVTTQPGTGGDRLLLLDDEGLVIQDIAQVVGRTSFDWSPNGAYLAVSSGPELGGIHLGQLVIYKIDADGKAARLAEVASDVIGFWWSPDGSRLAYLVPVLAPSDLTQPITFSRQDDPELYLQLDVFEISPQSTRRLTTFQPTPEFLRILSYFDQYQRSSSIWSADSGKLAYAAGSGDGAGEIFIVDAQGMKPPIAVAPGQIAYWSASPKKLSR